MTSGEKKTIENFSLAANGKPEYELNTAKLNNSQYNNKIILSSNNSNVGCSNNTQISNQISSNTNNVNSSDNNSNTNNNIPIVPKAAEKTNQGK